MDTTACNPHVQLARELPVLANAKSNPVSVVLADESAKRQAIEDLLGSVYLTFTRIGGEWPGRWPFGLLERFFS